MATGPDEITPIVTEEQARPALDEPPPSLARAAIAAAVAADPNLETATLTLPKEALEFLRSEAQKRNISTGDMVRVSIGTQKFLSEKTAAGAKVQIKDNSGTFDLAV